MEGVTGTEPAASLEIKPIMHAKAADLADHGAASDRE